LFGPFACPDLEEAACENARLLRALYHLSTFADGGVRRRVNYAGLDTEELGSIYESLLDYHPQVELGEPPRFALAWGSERKQTGSYYTPPELVRELIDSALVPVLEERLAAARTPEEKEAAVRGLKICDPASGSGHFLLAAARRLGQELARVRTGETEPAPEAYREAVRDIIRECLYAVDKNPLAVDLCKVALWLEGHFPGLPLSFLDHHVKCGDSLVGVFDLAALREGIPDAAFQPVAGDDRRAASHYRRRNREEREGQYSLFREALDRAADGPRALAPDFAALAGLAERTPRDVRDKEELYQSLRHSPAWHHLQVACDLWTAAFFAPLTAPPPGQTPLTPTTATLWSYLAQGSTQARLEAEARAMSVRQPFFHWPLEFPEVCAAGGFDVVLGNPPWEQLQPEEIKFFKAHQVREIWELSGVQRKRAIENLSRTDPDLATKWEGYKNGIERGNKFIRNAGRFPLTAVGKINTYSLFAELAQNLIHQDGRVGLIVPSGIATDDTTKFFFQDLMDARALVSLYDFENRQGIFPGVHRSYKFCLLTLAGAARPQGQGAEFAFFLQQVTDLKDAARRFTLSRDDLALLNPNTRTCPIFRSQRDAEITKAIYRRVPVLIRDGAPEGNPWGVQFRQGLFNMTSDSHLFRTRAQLEAEGWRLAGNVFVRPEAGRDAYPASVAAGFSLREDVWLPLYEAKMMHHFDHRWATYEGTDTRDVTLSDKMDPDFLALPRYWVPEEEVAARTAQAPKDLIQAWRARDADGTQAALTAWWLGYCLNRGLDPANHLRAAVLRYGLDPDKTRRTEAAMPLAPAEVEFLEARVDTFRLPAIPAVLDLAGNLIRARLPRWLLGWRDITNTTNERTVIAGALPLVGVGHTLPLKIIDESRKAYISPLLSNLTSLCFDYVARQCLGGTHLTFFIYKQLPVLPPLTYDRPCPWSTQLSLKDWLNPRVLELTYTAKDLSPFARELGYDGPPFRWDEERRCLIRCELDAAFFHLYGLSREEADYILDTFPIVKRKDEQQYGDYRTLRVILEIYDDLQRAMSTGAPYHTRLDPPPGDPRAAHGV
jgi:hypothetical protein